MAPIRSEAPERDSVQSPARLLSARVKHSDWQPKLVQLDRLVSMKEMPAIFHQDSSVAN